MPLIGVLVVTWNRKDDLLDCLRSVAASDYHDLAVYVVDNASEDGTAPAVLREFPDVRLIRSEENLGFAGGNNLGLDQMISDGVDAAFLLNDDAVVAEDTLIRLVEGFHDPSIGVLGPRILFHSEPDTIWAAGGMVDARTGIAVQRFYGELDTGQADDAVDVDYAVGCAMLVKTDAIRHVGLLNTDYYMYYEEADWCRRVRDAGYRVRYIPGSRVLHKVGRARDTRPHTVYYCARNRLLYLRRSGARPARVARAATGIARSVLGHAVHGRTDECRMMMRAVADYYSGRFGRLGEH